MQPPLIVVGVDVRLPGAESFESLTRELSAGRVATRSFPTERLLDAGLTTTPDDHYDGGFFDRIDEFDHRYFRVPARVAAAMDPYQRWCLLSSTRALHDAGLLGQVGGTRAGVYASCNTMQQAVYATLQRAAGVSPDLLAVLSSSVAARVSHHLDLRGPAVVLDTACSSSLYALTVACADLRSGAVDTAVVTAANLYLDPGARGTAAVDVVSPTSTTRSFDRAADGVSVGEGVVTLVLRRAEDRDDHAGAAGRGAYGSIESWGVGQDGRTATMAAPNPRAQSDLVDAAWSRPGVDARRLALLVTHGTGTAVGDAVELEALGAATAFAGLDRAGVPLVATKANVGHLDAASGLLSVAVALGALSTGTVPPHPSFVAPSLSSDLVDSPFFVPDERTPAAVGGRDGTGGTGGTGDPDGLVGLAGVSSFGMTGTNVHVVVGAGTRTPGPGADLGLELRRHWFVPEGNTFGRAAAAGPGSATVLGRRSATFTVDPRRDWEIAEHRVAGVPLMVGTAAHEIIAHLLRDAPYGLDDHDVTDLTMVRPLTGTGTAIELVATVDEETLEGRIAVHVDNHGDGHEPETWVRFRLRPTAGVRPLTDEAPTADGLLEIPVVTQVGDDDRVSVSSRWGVVTRLARSHDGAVGVLELQVPTVHVAEADRYDFYPPLLDAACNGLNALLVDGEVLLPWVDDRVAYHAPRLRGDRFTARIEHRETVRDERGNVIVRVDADLWDSAGRCVVSVRGHRVKNRPAAPVTVAATTVLGFDVAASPRPTAQEGERPGGTVAVVPLHGRDVTDWAAQDVVVVAPDTVLGDAATCRSLLAGIDEVVVVGGTTGMPSERADAAPHGGATGPSDRRPDVAADCHDLGLLLLALHRHSDATTVTLLEPGAYGGAITDGVARGPETVAHLRARAAAGHSLRTELRFDVAVLDAPARPDTVALLRTVVPRGILRLDPDGVVRSARLTTRPAGAADGTGPTDRATDGSTDRSSEPGDTVLVVGASTGIGRAYAEWLLAHAPGTRVVGCGRRSFDDAPPPFEYHVADVTDPAALARLAHHVGRPDHVVVLAGEAASGLFVTKGRDDFVRRMRSKVDGPHHLAAAFPDCPDLVLVGSVAGYVGALGQTEYAAANAYLTGLADGVDDAAPGDLSVAQSNSRFRSLSLGGWSEIGMSRDLIDELFVKTTPTRGLPAVHAFVTGTLRSASVLEVAPGADAYSPVLGSLVPTVPSSASVAPVALVAPVDAGSPAPHPHPSAASRPAPPSGLAGRAVTSLPTRPGPPASATSTAPTASPASTVMSARRPATSSQVRAQVLGAWERVLGVDDYADDVTFFEYGGDSISVVALGDELARSFPDVFDVTTLFSCATVADQARWVERSMGVGPDLGARTVDISAIQHLLEPNGGSR